MATTVPTVKLNNGVDIPQLGFGVFQVKPSETTEAVATALQVGYRHIDTAEMYGNEKEVGQAIARSGIDPAEVFVTSKLNNDQHSFDVALRAFDQTLTDLATDRIDLFLIHWPLPTVDDFVETWKALERVYAEVGAGHRRLQLPGRPSAPAVRRDRDRARGQSDRGPSLFRPGGIAGLRRRAWHCHRSVGTIRPRCCAA